VVEQLGLCLAWLGLCLWVSCGFFVGFFCGFFVGFFCGLVCGLACYISSSCVGVLVLPFQFSLSSLLLPLYCICCSTVLVPLSAPGLVLSCLVLSCLASICRGAYLCLCFYLWHCLPLPFFYLWQCLPLPLLPSVAVSTFASIYRSCPTILVSVYNNKEQ